MMLTDYMNTTKEDELKLWMEELMDNLKKY